MTLDNASNNDSIITELARRIDTFPGAPNYIRYFVHIINLVAKTVLRQFDMKWKAGRSSKGDIGSGDGGNTKIESLLAELVAGIGLDDLDVNSEE